MTDTRARNIQPSPSGWVHEIAMFLNKVVNEQQPMLSSRPLASTSYASRSKTLGPNAATELSTMPTQIPKPYHTESSMDRSQSLKMRPITVNTSYGARHLDDLVLSRFPGLNWDGPANVLVGDDLACRMLLGPKLCNNKRPVEEGHVTYIYLSKLSKRLSIMMNEAMTLIDDIKSGNFELEGILNDRRRKNFWQAVFNHLRANRKHWTVFTPDPDHVEGFIMEFVAARKKYVMDESMHLLNDIIQDVPRGCDLLFLPSPLPADSGSIAQNGTTEPDALDNEGSPLSTAAPKSEEPVSRRVLEWMWCEMLPALNEQQVKLGERVWKEDDLDEFMQDCPYPF
ncbi:hypothetical protein K4K55_001576 [Colletotrichum sp. SAR 10_96]|nr:hypothetical protein K4K55_001576 [Colletotrichum sp. SAR 10_96]